MLIVIVVSSAFLCKGASSEVVLGAGLMHPSARESAKMYHCIHITPQDPTINAEE